MLILPNAALIEALGLLTATGTGAFDAFTCHLYKNNFTPTVTSVVGDFDTADFTGYAPVTAKTWNTPYLLPSGIVASDGSLCHFVAGSPLTVPNTIYGYYLTNGAGTSLHAAGRFATPVPIAVALAGLSFSPQITMPQTGWGP